MPMRRCEETVVGNRGADADPNHHTEGGLGPKASISTIHGSLEKVANASATQRRSIKPDKRIGYPQRILIPYFGALRRNAVCPDSFATVSKIVFRKIYHENHSLHKGGIKSSSATSVSPFGNNDSSSDSWTVFRSELCTLCDR